MSRPDAWYEDALESIEAWLAREAQEKEWAEQLKDLEWEEEQVPAEEQEDFAF